ncbi:transferase [Lithospermum erythrorhizon]|uniref:glutathione transferase n=1 Tax=Lithospermum erythrorhizon TaxID=34254 RepID=A0AAV3NRT7_LITER
MATSEVKVLGIWPSPYVIRARIALNIKSVNYEFVQEPIGSKSELLLKSNPIHKKIPVMIHGDKIICESLIIVQYIDEFWSSAPQILPSDPYDRAITRFWGAYIDHKLFPSMRIIALGHEDNEVMKKELNIIYESFALLEDVFQKSSNGKKFFGGENIGYLDIALGCNLGWVRVTEKMNNVKVLDEEKTPGLYKWSQDFSDDDAVKELIPETEKMIEAGLFFMNKMKASQS